MAIYLMSPATCTGSPRCLGWWATTSKVSEDTFTFDDYCSKFVRVETCPPPRRGHRHNRTGSVLWAVIEEDGLVFFVNLDVLRQAA